MVCRLDSERTKADGKSEGNLATPVYKRVTERPVRSLFFKLGVRMFNFIKPNILRVVGLIGAVATGIFTMFSTGDLVTGAGIILAGFSTAGLKREDE